jgi:hypothetical protein
VNVDFLAGTYSVTLICKGAQYGSGTGAVTVSGSQVSMTWQVNVAQPASGDFACDAQATGPGFPASGQFAGTATLGGSNTVVINLTSWQASPCVDGGAPPTQATFRGAAVGIPIGTCVSSNLFGQLGYQAVRIGP